MDRKEIDRLRVLCERATDGPWEYAGYGLVMSKEYDAKVCHQATRGDAEFIAAAREALPKLLDEVERLHGIIDCQEPPRLSIDDITEASKYFGTSIVDSPEYKAEQRRMNQQASGVLDALSSTDK